MGASFTSSSSKKRASLPAFPQPRVGSDYPRVHEEQQAERELQRYYDATLQARRRVRRRVRLRGRG